MEAQLPEWYDELPKGWREVVETLHGNLLLLDRKYVVSQAKEKWGGLRVYLSSPETPQILDAIAHAEWKSEKTCEECGGLAHLVNIRQWWRALCKQCQLKDGIG
jgi:hypothetical protein